MVMTNFRSIDMPGQKPVDAAPKKAEAKVEKKSTPAKKASTKKAKEVETKVEESAVASTGDVSDASAE